MDTFTFRVPVRRPRDWNYNYNTLNIDQPVSIIPEPSNVFDENALGIHDTSGAQIGYVPAEIAAKLAPKINTNSWVISKASICELEKNYETGWVAATVEITLGVLLEQLERR